MGIEIERRFLVKNMDKVNELVKQYTDSKKTIIQDYVYSDVLTAIRKRKIVKNDNEKYIYTIKTGFNSLSINEFEEEMTKEQYDSIKPDSSRWTIEKDRYIIPYENGLKIELDVFHGKYEGLIFAEIEFESEDQAKNANIPDWFDVEIGKIISNNSLSKGIDDIDAYIKSKM
ncbi:MAG: hypothetical protein IKE91_06830 [Clostridia bacterium]|nr:hypothetical protein [Clostridia bacterium]